MWLQLFDCTRVVGWFAVLPSLASLLSSPMFITACPLSPQLHSVSLRQRDPSLLVSRVYSCFFLFATVFKLCFAFSSPLLVPFGCWRYRGVVALSLYVEMDSPYVEYKIQSQGAANVSGFIFTETPRPSFLVNKLQQGRPVKNTETKTKTKNQNRTAQDGWMSSSPSFSRDE